MSVKNSLHIDSRYTDFRAESSEEDSSEFAALQRALARQVSGDDHDAGLIVERLAWTPEQRLEANAAFLRFYYSGGAAGPVIRED